MTTTAISTRLSTIIEQRRQRLPAAKSAVRAWGEVNKRLLELEGSIGKWLPTVSWTTPIGVKDRSTSVLSQHGR